MPKVSDEGLSLARFYRDHGEKMRSRQTPPRSPGTIQQDWVAIRLFERMMGALPIKEITPSVLREFGDVLGGDPFPRSPRGRRSAATVAKVIGAITYILVLAEEAGVIAAAPRRPRLARVATSDARGMDAWTWDEVESLLAACSRARGVLGKTGIPAGVFFRSLVLFLWNTKLRVGTAMALTWDLVDRDEPGYLSVPGKLIGPGKQDKRLFLSYPARRAIDEIRRKNRPRLFPWPRWPAAKTHLYWRFGRIVRASGLPQDRQFRFDALRADRRADLTPVTAEPVQSPAPPAPASPGPKLSVASGGPDPKPAKRGRGPKKSQRILSIERALQRGDQPDQIVQRFDISVSYLRTIKCRLGLTKTPKAAKT